MAGPNNKFIKKQKTELRLKKKKEKEQKKQERRENSTDKSFESMIAYVDKFGNITSEPPVEKESRKEQNENPQI